MDSRKDAVKKAVELVGGPHEVALRRGFKHAENVRIWMRTGEVPAEHILWLAEQTGWHVTPHQIDPTFYPHAEDGLPEAERMRAARTRHVGVASHT